MEDIIGRAKNKYGSDSVGLGRGCFILNSKVKLI